MNMFSYILQNGSGKGYESGDGDSAAISSLSIETLVIQGAGYFLEANSSIQTLLNRVEWQDFNGLSAGELEQLSQRAFTNIILAGMTYEQLSRVAESTPYNREFIAKLQAFDYHSYMTEMGLNAVVFNRLKVYLEKGDITGTFKHAHANMAVIKDLLTEIKTVIADNRLPGLSLLWKLNETCAETLLFGSYAARVFHVIH